MQVNHTEDLEKVRLAVENIFGVLPIKTKNKTWGKLLVSNIDGIDGLSKFSNLLEREKIVAAARKLLRNMMNENSINFYLNKQVAYAGHISFSEPIGESPLGPIKVQIRTNYPKEVIDWLAPKPPIKTRRKTSIRK